MANPTYGEIAAKLGIQRCAGEDNCPADHRSGSWEIVDGEPIVHWADRARVERSGVRRFLRHAACAFVASGGESRPWARLYLAQAVITNWSSQIGMRLPSADYDRVMLRAMLVSVPTSEPLREEAMDWAQRK